MNHLLQKNKIIQLKLDFELQRKCGNGDIIEENYSEVIPLEMEPVINKYPNGTYINSWKSIYDITIKAPQLNILLFDIPDEQKENLMIFFRWCKNNQYKSKAISRLEAIQIFRNELPAICYDNISTEIDTEYWKDLVMTVRKQGRMRSQEKLKTAKQVSIEDVVRRFGYEPKMNFINCPFHGSDSSASLKIYPNTNTWHCFGCHEGNSTVDFVMKVNGCTLNEAINYLT